jgi:hypothetical protein
MRWKSVQRAYKGIIMHHSACPSINGKGYDYMIMKDGTIVTSPEPFNPDWLHLCLEGDFDSHAYLDADHREQFFILQKLLLRLYRLYRLTPDDIVRHKTDCPGNLFPWSELVISPADGYH